MKRIFDIRLFFAIGLTTLGFLFCVTAFTQVYQTHHYLPYPEIRTISAENDIAFLAVGDIMLSRNVARHAEKGGGPEWLWKNIGDVLRESDFVFGNLEGTTNGTEIYSYEKTLTFNALPSLINTLPGVNFRIVNLANNHALDQGKSGLTTTEKLLKNIGIDTIGASTGKDPWTPHMIEKDGVKIVFIGASYASHNDNGSTRNPWVARMQDTGKLIDALGTAQKMGDIIVVTMHAGQEYTHTPSPLQESFAKTAIDHGADIVIGAHPHWIQTVEKYREKYIVYSLGNFVFDQEFSQETKEGIMLRVNISPNTKNITTIEILPIVIENYGQPRLAEGEEKKIILEKNGLSDFLE